MGDEVYKEADCPYCMRGYYVTPDGVHPRRHASSVLLLRCARVRLDFSIATPKEPEETEGERLARFFATSEHDRARSFETFEVTGVRWFDASEPRNDLCDVLMMESPTSPGYGERLYDAMATDAYRREEDRRAAELREAVAAIRDDFDNLPDA